jgi:hypothetical protein
LSRRFAGRVSPGGGRQLPRWLGLSSGKSFPCWLVTTSPGRTQKGCQGPVAMGPKAAPGLESEYKPKLPAGRLPGASNSLLIKRSGVRIPLRAPAESDTEYDPGRRVALVCPGSSTVVRPKRMSNPSQGVCDKPAGHPPRRSHEDELRRWSKVVGRQNAIRVHAARS